MTSPSQVTDGEMSQFKGLLTNGGLTAEIIRAAIDDHGVAKAMVEGGKAYLAQIIEHSVAYPIPSDYRGPYWDERAEGPYWTYPEGWPEASGTPAVLECDPDFFKGIDFSHVDALVKRYRTGPDGAIILPEHMTALAVIPKLESIAKLVRKPKKSWKPENIAIQYLLGVLNDVYGKGFYDWTEGKIGPEYQRLAEATAKALAMDASRTPGDVHVLPVQTGALFAGYSVRAARGHLSAMPNHYGMHGFGGGVIMLPHQRRPERFQEGTLFMDCPGTERSPCAGGAFDDAPYWIWGGGERGCYSDWVSKPDQCAGSGSFVALPAKGGQARLR